MVIVWSLSTLVLAWLGGVSRKERSELMHFSRKRLVAVSGAD
jgi:hypothetical protein